MAWRNSRLVGPASSVTVWAGGTTDDSVRSTSSMRSAHTAARGMSTAMNVAIITDMRICVR